MLQRLFRQFDFEFLLYQGNTDKSELLTAKPKLAFDQQNVVGSDSFPRKCILIKKY
jgi:hypothetical protein